MDFATFGTVKYVIGNGSLQYLTNYKGKKMAITIDAGIIKPLNMEEVLYKNILEANGIDYKIICEVPQEPRMADMDEPIKRIQEYQPDVIVGIGGGASMDTAKGLLTFLEFPDMTWEKATGNNVLPKFSGKHTLIAVPTTSGTGSETSMCAVFKGYDLSKQMILSPEIRPNLALMDFDLLKSLPHRNIAYSGADALAHAIEASVSTIASPMVVAQGVAATTTILYDLKASWDGDQEARKRIHMAAAQAGGCIDNAITGMAHGMDGAGGDFHLAHGCVTGMLLPYTMLYIGKHPVYNLIARNFGITGSDEEVTKKLVDKIWELYDAIQMPKTFKDVNVPEEAYLNNIPKYVKRSLNDANIMFAPCKPTAEDLEKLYKQFYYGVDYKG